MHLYADISANSVFQPLPEVGETSERLIFIPASIQHHLLAKRGPAFGEVVAGKKRSNPAFMERGIFEL